MILFDSHAHMDDRRFDGDRAELLADFPAQGVKRIMNAACDLESSLAGIRLCSEYGWIVSAVGSHPDDADHVDEERIEIYRRLAAEHPCVRAIGEIGLDYHYEDVPRDVQKRAFRMQMRLARELELPVIVHEREAHADGLEIETDCPYMAPEPFRGRRCDPRLVRFVAKKLAEIRGITEDEAAQATFENACRLFRINDHC